MIDLKTKQNLILEYVRLGMELERAYILAEVSDAERDIIEADDEFLYKVKFNEALLEKDLLEKFHNVMLSNAKFGNSTELRWMLPKLNKRWDTGSTKEPERRDKDQVHVYIPDNGRSQI